PEVIRWHGTKTLSVGTVGGRAKNCISKVLDAILPSAQSIGAIIRPDSMASGVRSSLTTEPNFALSRKQGVSFEFFKDPFDPTSKRPNDKRESQARIF